MQSVQRISDYYNAGEQPDLRTQLGSLPLKNPILAASGTFGYGEELAAYCDIARLGAIISKTVTRRSRAGNATPRVCETASGMLNAIGLQNVGLDRFLSQKLPFLRTLSTPIIVNIAGETVDDFAELAAQIGAQPGVAAIELNISCPNVAHGLDFATDPHLTEEVARRARQATSTPLIAKLSPNVTDLAVIARAAENGGVAALSLVNTFVGMAINARTRRPRISNVTGGLSGPAIKPLALRAVYRCAGAVKIPVIGIGGIMSGEDAAEFLIAGARAVQVGTANFVQPDAATRVLDELGNFMREQNIGGVSELIGSLKV
jgi:dihydroorotate dehydrogenase (NAD+) catalytic subunit